ncbi:Holliday junction branch migration protein RuvA [Campylobacter geochelonis]|uniref:Holliday junction branch migration complex subunit RuvA n=1 Tax=Campylobacter geochelonis TaxID=1780362 RepID=A0A128EQR0_9BACT|nr:Holliday junction branch migration protein RuvA [Campylobacter geochelonis]QKF71323.1 RuvABC resolvasome, subunit RuvA [Campylobacter geochelonis]CZE48042.1 Holliday junction DNA helicase RuvA [Campylobacter geochelonis]CZE48207.1 Holliday junction DNA helicase RuvA [Campylobacter geochelonis]CZE51059.1 Holliday junction DNA helicase RuvA [Campylobacter geochelonis]
MIAAVEGVITKKEPGFAVLKTVGGVSYGIIISLNTSANLTKGEKVELITTPVIREDANLLYGFLDVKEQKMFEVLIKVSGIGPSTAMAVCSSLSATSFTNAVINGDVATLTTVPGIGPKTARKMLAELSDAKLISEEGVESYKNESALALESLGFKRDKILKVLSTCSSTNTSDLIKEALKKLA